MTTLRLPTGGGYSPATAIWGFGAPRVSEQQLRDALRDLIGYRYRVSRWFDKARSVSDAIGDGYPIGGATLQSFNAFTRALRDWSDLDIALQAPIDRAIDRAIAEGKITRADVPRGLRSQDAGGWFAIEDAPAPNTGLGLAFLPVLAAVAVAAIAAGFGSRMLADIDRNKRDIERLAQQDARMHAEYVRINDWRMSRGQQPIIPQTPNGPQTAPPADFGDKALKAGGGALLLIGALVLGSKLIKRKRGAA